MQPHANTITTIADNCKCTHTQHTTTTHNHTSHKLLLFQVESAPHPVSLLLSLRFDFQFVANYSDKNVAFE